MTHKKYGALMEEKEEVADKLRSTLEENEQLLNSLEEITTAYNSLKPEHELMSEECIVTRLQSEVGA